MEAQMPITRHPVKSVFGEMRVRYREEASQRAGPASAELRNEPARPVGSGTARSRLTPREYEIVQLLAEGKSNKEVAASLGISVKTVETHRANMMRKLGLHSVTELVRYALRDGIIEA